jgi:hypothetical protein
MKRIYAKSLVENNPGGQLGNKNASGPHNMSKAFNYGEMKKYTSGYGTSHRTSTYWMRGDNAAERQSDAYRGLGDEDSTRIGKGSIKREILDKPYGKVQVTTQYNKKGIAKRRTIRGLVPKQKKVSKSEGLSYSYTNPRA